MQPLIPKRKGRPIGGTSLVDIKLADLIAALGTDQLVVPIGRVWLEKHGLSVVTPSPTILVVSAPTIPHEEKIEFKLTTFED